MRVNEGTMLFEGLNEEDVHALYKLALNVVVAGRIDWDSYYLQEWLNVCFGSDTRHRLLVVTTVFPARAFISLVKWYRARHNERPADTR